MVIWMRLAAPGVQPPGYRLFAYPTPEKMNGSLKILPYQRLVWEKADRVPATPLPDCIDTGRCRFVPVHTPGHSKDHTVYLETRNGWLFSGDLYLGNHRPARS